jgi:hypothetical protein
MEHVRAQGDEAFAGPQSGSHDRRFLADCGKLYGPPAYLGAASAGDEPDSWTLATIVNRGKRDRDGALLARLTEHDLYR